MLLRKLLPAVIGTCVAVTPVAYAGTTQSHPTIANPNFTPKVSVARSLPHGFNPLTATNQELEKYNFPPRPSGGADLTAWTKAMQHFKEFITPKYGKSNMHTDLATGQPGLSSNSDSGSVANATGTGNYYTDNWSGYVDYNTTGNDFTDVHGTWTVPSISSPDNSYYSSWVGFGGFTFSGHSSPSVMQAGVQAELNNSGGFSLTPWWEIYPYNYEQPITNLTISPGDTLYTDISYTTNNGGTFSWYLEDETTGQAIPVQKITGVSPYYDGTEAEWIVERPTVNGSLSSLGDFGSSGIAYSSCSTNNTANMHEGLGDSTNYQVEHLEMTSNGESTGTPLANASSISSSTVGYTDYWHGSN